MRIYQIVKGYYQKSPTNFALFTSAIMIIFLFSAEKIFEQMKPRPQGITIKEKNYLDDMLPEGMTIVPIQLINGDGLSSLFHLEAQVDLYSLHPVHKRKQKILENAKIIKSPSETHPFSLILSEQLVTKIPQLGEPMFAVLKSRRKKSTKPRTGTTGAKSRQINIGGEEI
ncbi:MAG: hypothetical protein NZ480_04160 [Bdellovibrionaceae bacterium]|nr:hypothetical protein [Pseudobdellovibrionaceae bacterium]MDW8189953.1 hypothetical protein [Pseudobdellovibrionaceae bacterium]